ncbi:M24 family metallopeptidase [Paenibacillus alkalitolerans]|uniref:M24 family metallopeptidase n=1 Tax=Paenibacillus alkalitolerans TaxID=2799335 RepID=UPI0018F3455D|nr:Xaa-Pro peptidase family protein [Paenibacillus alkalitolerans]
MSVRRLEKLRSKFDELQVDGMLIASPHNRRYMTGFTGTAGVVLITLDDAALITDFRYTAQAEEQAAAFRTIRQGVKLSETVKETAVAMGIERLGIEKHLITLDTFLTYEEELKGIRLVPVKDVVESLRNVKDDDEIALIKKAAGLADKAFEHILTRVRPGVREREIAAELQYYMQTGGAFGFAYSMIIASGERSALPHGVASDKRIGNDEFVTMDFGANYEGYLCDLTRTVFVGKPSEKHKEIYNIVLEANMTVLERIRPGMSSKEADSLGRDVIGKYGYGDYFGHGLGHGFGLEIHENPFMSQQRETELLPGMVLTVEPGIYIPGFGGVRIEDDILLTETGVEVLTRSDKSLICL